MIETHAVLDEIVANSAELFKAARGYGAAVALHDPARLAAGLRAYEAIIQSDGETIVHGDAHVGNSYTLPDGSVGFLDWQTVGRGCWAHDVAYFLTSALDVPVRRAHERDLITHYWSIACELGLALPHPVEVFDFYRSGIFYGFLVWLGNSDRTQPSEINFASFARSSTAMLDHDVYSVLGV